MDNAELTLEISDILSENDTNDSHFIVSEEIMSNSFKLEPQDHLNDSSLKLESVTGLEEIPDEFITVDCDMTNDADDVDHVTELIEEPLSGALVPKSTPISNFVQINLQKYPKPKIIMKTMKQKKVVEKESMWVAPSTVSIEAPTVVSMKKASMNEQVSPDDVRSRLHFIKYMKQGEKSFRVWECGICGKEFSHQYTLMRHLPTHTDERMFSCNECGKAFRQLSTLAQHRVTHSELRVYVCSECKKTFNRVSTLISHQKTHSIMKDHECKVCGRSFHQKGNLKNHMFTHSDIRPYKCSVCGRGFNQSSNLRTHQAKSHPANSSVNSVQNGFKFRCNSCNLTFSRHSQLMAHKHSKHNASTQSVNPLDPVVSRLIKRRQFGDTRILPLAEMASNVKSKDNKLGLEIDAINTPAMQLALSEGRVPFALLKLLKGNPVVVKVQQNGDCKHTLVPASADELRSAGKFSVHNQTSKKCVQINVPVVATIKQSLDSRGHVFLQVESAVDDSRAIENRVETANRKGGETEKASIGLGLQTTMSDAMIEDENEEEVICAFESSSIVPCDGSLLDAATLSTNETDIGNHFLRTEGVQFLKQVSPGEFEVVTQGDGTASHLLTEDGQIHCIQNYAEDIEESGHTVTVDQANISELMDALQSAGYQLAPVHDGTSSDLDIIQPQITENDESSYILESDSVGQFVLTEPTTSTTNS